MRIYIFKSDASRELRAFAGDNEGSKLPPRLRPCQAVGVVASGSEPPHKLSRANIEKAIEDDGFQLWRLKKD
jgi:hypothetical protein